MPETSRVRPFTPPESIRSQIRQDPSAFVHIQPSFWLKLKRLCIEALDPGDPLRSEIEACVDRVAECASSDRDAMMVSLVEALGRMTSAAETGFLIGYRLPVSAYGVLSLGLMTAPTVGDALRFVADVHRSAVPLVSFAYEQSATEGRFTVGFRCPIDSAGEALVVAMCAAAIDGEIARRSGRCGNFARLELTSSSKGADGYYRKFLAVAPHTDGKANALILSRAVLDLGTPHADADTFHSVMNAGIARTERLVGGVCLLERVREILMSDIGAPPSLNRLAERLDLTPRQLRVRLERQRTSYQALIRDCRTRYASALFQNPALSLSQIADRLGYSDVSAFSHAFCRWTGQSPSRFRLRMQSHRGAVWNDGPDRGGGSEPTAGAVLADTGTPTSAS